MSYEPLKGSVAHRAIEHLKTLAAGVEIATGPLCDAIGMDRPDTLNAYMAPALAAHLVSRRIIPEKGRMNWWRLGAGAGFVPAPMPVPRPGSDVPAPSRAPGAPPAPTKLCADCDRQICRDKGCMNGRQSQVTAPEATPTPAPAKPAPTLADASTSEVVGLEVEEQTGESTEEEVEEVAFNFWHSGVTGEMVLHGVHVDDEGDVTLSREQVLAIQRYLCAKQPNPWGRVTP